MPETIYAAFADPSQAENAAGALLDHGVRAEDISLVVSEEYQKRRGTPDDPELHYTTPQTISGKDGRTSRLDPLENDLRPGPMHIQGGNITSSDTTVTNASEVNVEDDLNPAQNDYPRTMSGTTTELSSRPPDSKYDYNPDLDKRDYNRDYVADVDRENRKEAERDIARRQPENMTPEADAGIIPVTPQADTDIDRHDTNKTVTTNFDHERAAKGGITTTTPEDAADAAKKGVGIGLGVGALAAIAALTIPGFGVVLGGGALATALAGLAASAGAGAVAGGVVGYLKDQGVPAHDIPKYQQTYDGGGAILQVTLADGVDRTRIQEVLDKYGAQQVNQYGYAA
jgi:hypothetical protein